MISLISILAILILRSTQLLTMPEVIAASTIENIVIGFILLGIGYVGSRAVL